MIELEREMNLLESASEEAMVENLFSVLKWFQSKGFGNPFNYNRGFEYIQSQMFGFELTRVGGGSDGINNETNETAEFKATSWKGIGRNNRERTHSFSYNGTSRFESWENQRAYCEKKIMRDPYHYWSIVDYEKGSFIKTFKVPAKTVWKLIEPKWYKSWQNPKSNDPRIGCQVSTKSLEGEEFETIIH